MARKWRPHERETIRGRAVLLHDLAASASAWWRVGPELAVRGWETIAVDLPAHGTKPPRDRALDMASIVRAVITDFPGRADLLIGHGFGGVVALTLCGRYADAASAVIVEDPPVGSAAQHDLTIRTVLLESAYARVDAAEMARRLTRDHPAWQPGDIACTIEGLAAADTPVIVAGLRRDLSWDLAGLTRALRVPLLVITGSEDNETTVLRGPERKLLRDLLPAGHFAELSGGHCVHRDSPGRWLATVMGFANEIL